ncbi:MAG: ATP-binding cassette domain-containing protein, partial [Alphaproteobacteria bacterium]|nr:ATP-binding cassette domain-containing protein [Alphaproteobacteria bacterium]
VSAFDRDERALLRCHTFGFIYQRYNLLETSTAQENVELPAIYAGVKKNERAEHAAYLLDKLGLEGRKRNRPNEMSGGQQQRVAIARALVNDPDVILADEPTGALDSQSGREVLDLLRRLNAEGRTVIVITHDEKVANFARRQIVIADGKIVSDSGRTMVNPLRAREAGADHGHAIAEASEAIKMATRALHVNMFRTFLTLLGIIIGVASVVVMLAIGDGSKQNVLDQISSMGTNLIMIRPGAPGIRASGDIATLTPEDAEAIAKIPNVTMAVPERSRNFTVRRNEVDTTTSVTGTSPDQPTANNWPVAQGSAMSEADYRSMAPIALIGQTVARSLFPGGEDPIGKFIMVKNIPFEVIGVMSVKGASPFGSDRDDVVFVPLTTGFVRLFGKSFVGTITAVIEDLSRIDETQNAIGKLLLERHKIEDFQVRNMASFIQTATETQNTLTLLLGAVAAISLLVGGIGVMNIMLVSVTERTREIGIRMATGARTRDIMIQFLTEAVVVCLTGGLLGVALSVTVSLALDFFGMRTILSVLPVALAFLCAVSTGVLFGYLPARKAAHLDPVVALASE